MFKVLIPIVGVLIAVGIFITYVQPTYLEIRQIQAETAEYADAAARASEIEAEVNALKAERDAVPLADLERLEALLPDEIDEVAFLNDLSALAARHALALREVQVGGEDPTSVSSALSGRVDLPDEPVRGSAAQATLPPEEGGVASSARGGFSTLNIFFSVSGSYDRMRTFLNDLERSLVLTEITKLEFMQPEEGLPVFRFGVRLHALNTDVR